MDEENVPLLRSILAADSANSLAGASEYERVVSANGMSASASASGRGGASQGGLSRSGSSGQFFKNGSRGPPGRPKPVSSSGGGGSGRDLRERGERDSRDGRDRDRGERDQRDRPAAQRGPPRGLAEEYPQQPPEGTVPGAAAAKRQLKGSRRAACSPPLSAALRSFPRPFLHPSPPLAPSAPAR